MNLASKLGFYSIPIHPLIFINISLIAGIYWGKNNYSFIYPIILYIAILLYSTYKSKFLSNIMLCLFFFVGAILYFKQQNNFYKFKEKFNFNNWDIIGTIEDISFYKNNEQKNWLIFNIHYYKLNNDKNNKWHRINNKIKIFINKLPCLKVGDQLKINNLLFKYSNNLLYDNYLIKENLYSSLFPHFLSYEFLYRPKFSLARFIWQNRNSLTEKIKLKLSQNSFTLYSSIFLGEKNCVKNELENKKELFKVWGLSHYLARSGLHLVIIISLWNIILTLLGITFFIKNFIVILIIGIYHLLSYPSIPFVRALLLFIIYKICIFNNWQINVLHILNITTFIILFFNPVQLFFLDFQLSFGLTYAIVWLSHISKTQKLIN